MRCRKRKCDLCKQRINSDGTENTVEIKQNGVKIYQLHGKCFENIWTHGMKNSSTDFRFGKSAGKGRGTGDGIQ